MTTETGTFLQRVALASLVAIPIAASSAVILSSDLDDDNDERPCDGCGHRYPPEVLTPGEDDTHWCSACVDAAAELLGIDPIFIDEDGEP